MHKQLLRSYTAKASSYTEIYISVLTLIGIIIFSVNIIKDIYTISMDIYDGTNTISVEVFLSHTLQLIIGIEFIKMLAKHTPGSVVEVLLFAVARKLIVGHSETMLDLLVGVIVIAILFIIRKYLTMNMTHSGSEKIFSGGTTVEEVNKALGLNIPTNIGHTLAGLIVNHSEEKNEVIKPGKYIRLMENIGLRVYSMDDHLIRQVEVVVKNKSA